MRIHPHSILLQELAAALERKDDRQALAHALRCPDCQEYLLHLLARERSDPADEKLAKVLPWSRPPVDYGPAFAASSSEYDRRLRLYEKERAQAPALLAELCAQPAERRESLLHQARFQTWGVLELLVQSGREESHADGSRAEELAQFALRLADGLDPALYGAERIEDQRARAWAHIANARRVRSDLDGAEAAFEHAFLHLRLGTRESLDRAVVLDLKASLLRDRRCFLDALRLLRRAYQIFHEFGDTHRAGRVLVKLSTIHHCVGEPEDAIRVLYQALELANLDEEPRLRLIIVHNLLDDLAEAGRFMEARELFRQAGELYDRFPDPPTRNRRKWVQGKIARGVGQIGQAEVLWISAREGFIAEGIPYDTALVSLDLASLYAEQGAVPALRQLAQEMVVIFSSHKIHREALAALAYLQQALEAERATVELIRRVAAFLKRAERDPGLRFEPDLAP